MYTYKKQTKPSLFQFTKRCVQAQKMDESFKVVVPGKWLMKIFFIFIK